MAASGSPYGQMKNDFLSPQSTPKKSKPNKLATGGKAVYNFLIGDSINTLRDPNASKLSKAFATADLVSNLIPGGAIAKNAGKAAFKVGAKVLKEPAKKAAKKIGKVFSSLFGGSKKKKGNVPCHCFTAGTKVLTEEGEKSIEDVDIGDKVLAKNPETGEMAYKEVDMLFQREVDETYNITVGTETITTTDEHPFWIKDKGWVKAQDLVIGDELETSVGTYLSIHKIEVKQEHHTVYNFRVVDFHTYYVSNLKVLTHNTECDINGKGVNGNSKASKKSQHGYEISEKLTGDVVKPGISGQRLNKNGTSPRANNQVNKWNKDAGYDKYEAKIVKQSIPNRQQALNWERQHAQNLWDNGNSLSKHQRPRPWE